MRLLKKQKARVLYWYPAGIVGGGMSMVYFVFGNTPFLRALALAVVLMGIALSLRRLGVIYSIGGAGLLGFSPVYWQQVGGPPTLNTWFVLGFIMAAMAGAVVLLTVSRRVFMSVAVGVTIFVGLYLLFGITQKSLRLTTVLSAWLIYMTIVALRQSNPRPDEPPLLPLSQRHLLGMLLMLILGVFNDPLITLFAPAMILGVWLSRAEMPRWYWGILFLITVIGGGRVFNEYISPTWSFLSVHELGQLPAEVPYIVFSAWQDPQQWINLTLFMSRQFTPLGIVLGVIGIARMSRWYPTLGSVLMIAYSCYGVFGLLYFGGDKGILLLPMVMIQVICITYAVFSVGQWIQQSFNRTRLSGNRLFWQTSTK